MYNYYKWIHSRTCGPPVRPLPYELARAWAWKPAIQFSYSFSKFLPSLSKYITDPIRFWAKIPPLTAHVRFSIFFCMQTTIPLLTPLTCNLQRLNNYDMEYIRSLFSYLQWSVSGWWWGGWVHLVMTRDEVWEAEQEGTESHQKKTHGNVPAKQVVSSYSIFLSILISCAFFGIQSKQNILGCTLKNCCLL